MDLLSVNDFSIICRLCLERKEIELQPIFKRETKNEQKKNEIDPIVEIVSLCFGLNVCTYR